METSINKETFKLLKISDDSKSFSDLDLPQITNQRKRKVRRKTRPRLVSSSNTHSDVNTTSSRQCSTLVLWIVIFISCCWLITLSYMIAVIHTENLRLEVEIKKLSITTQDLPDSLQQWHETSKKLEQNQTVMYIQISELKQNVNRMISQIKAKVDETKDYIEIQKLLAKFGATIEAVRNDIEQLKDRITAIQKNYTAFVTIASFNAINDTLTKQNKNLTEEINNQQQKFDYLNNTIEQDRISYNQRFFDTMIAENKTAEEFLELKNYLNKSISDLHLYVNKTYTEIDQNFGLFQIKNSPNSTERTEFEEIKSTMEPNLSTPNM